MTLFQVIVEGEDWGEVDLQPRFVFNTLVAPRGFAYFCQHCCRIWASIRREGVITDAYAIPCHQHHRSINQPGGSIWLDAHPHLTGAFGDEILKRESRRHAELDQAEAQAQAA